MKLGTVRTLVIAALVGLIFGAGWLANGWRKGIEIAEIQRAHEEAARQAAEVNIKKLADAQVRGDRLLLQLNGWEQTLTAFAEEKNREIARLTTGRPCLAGAAVQLLNRQPASRGDGAGPQAAGQPIRPDAGAAADPDLGEEGYATDTDVALWINQCQRGYDTCRGRLDSIRRFYEVTESEWK